jgi:hypothetical protein
MPLPLSALPERSARPLPLLGRCIVIVRRLQQHSKTVPAAWKKAKGLESDSRVLSWS